VNNYARISGGAIHNDGRNVSLTRCTFNLNRAGLYGGALAMAGKSMCGSVPWMAALVGPCPEPVTCMAAAVKTSWQPPLLIMKRRVLLIMQVAAVANPQHIACSVMNRMMPLARNEIPVSINCTAAL
jgi:predicted outer membrane repeat protein